MSEYAKSENGVCFILPLAGGEFTLCGIAYDDEESGGHTPCSATTVTCPDCITVIRAVRDVKTRRK